MQEERGVEEGVPRFRRGEQEGGLMCPLSVCLNPQPWAGIEV